MTNNSPSVLISQESCVVGLYVDASRGINSYDKLARDVEIQNACDKPQDSTNLHCGKI